MDSPNRAPRPSRPLKKNDLTKRRGRRMTFVGVLFCLMLAYLAGRVWYFKYVHGEYELETVRQLITSRNNAERAVKPNRGVILDRNRQVLAGSTRVYTVALDVSISHDERKPKTNDDGTVTDPRRETIQGLNEILGIPVADLEALYAENPDGSLVSPTNWKVLAHKVPAAEALAADKLYDVHLQADTQRSYSDPTLAPQTIGFLRGNDPWGLEAEYNAELTGEEGRTYSVYDGDGGPVTNDVAPRDGYTLVTTLDAGISRIAQDIVDEYAAKIECRSAAMIIMQPYTGELLAMAQWPSFSLENPDDPALFTNKRVGANWDLLTPEQQSAEKTNVWRNFHTNHTFEPGSIFKPIVVAAALEENIINPDDYTHFCTGSVQIPGWPKPIPCWHASGHGSQDLRGVLMNSCNMGMIDIVGKLGKDLFYKYRTDFGYADWTDIDLPGETAVSASAVMYGPEDLGPVNLATSGMGQGFNNTTIQAVTAFSAVINGGNLMKPYVVSQIMDDRGNIISENKPKIVRKVISAETSDYLRETMRATVDGGTGKGAAISGYAIGGKTGSAQQGDRETGGMTLSFMAYTPTENPEYVVLATLDYVADKNLLSSASVSPMIRETLEAIIRYKNMRPTAEESAEAEAPERVMSDYSGMNIVEVTKKLNDLGIDYHVIGAGTVVTSHVPKAGVVEPKNAAVYLYLDPETQIPGEMTVVPDVMTLDEATAVLYLSDAGLVPVRFRDDSEIGGDSDGSPTTYYPEESSALPDGAADASAPPGGAEAAAPYEVYRQFPSPHATVPRGTEVKLKVRIHDQE